MTGIRLGEQRWPELAGRSTLLLQPVGSCEQHGPHLPLSTDTVIAEAVALAAADRLRRRGLTVLCAPPIAFGASGEHQDFPGTVSIGHDALCQVLVEVGRSACAWAGRLVFVNGHGGNVPTVRAATAQLRAEGRDVRWHPCTTPNGAAHAGRDETSLMLALAGDQVRPAAARPGATEPLAQLMPTLRSAGVAAVSPNGVLGDPAGASADEGRALLADLVADLTRAVLHGTGGSAGSAGSASGDRG